jgi:hypothetical protein
MFVVEVEDIARVVTTLEFDEPVVVWSRFMTRIAQGLPVPSYVSAGADEPEAEPADRRDVRRRASRQVKKR